jgi:hypothetical protein
LLEQISGDRSFKRLLARTAVAAALSLGLSSATAASRVDQPVDPGMLDALGQASRSGLTLTGPPPRAPLLHHLKGAPGLGSERPGILYVGADYCPFCAAVRWPLALALLRFGDLGGLHYMRSSPTDIFPNTVTFSFAGADYHSALLSFEAVEVQDRQGHRLQRLTERQSALFERFDDTPYTNSPGGIPFLYIGGRYLEIGASFSPGLLAGRTWPEVVETLRKDPAAPLSRQILGQANLLSAAFCELTAGKPEAVCRAPGVRSAAEQLPR